MKRRHRLGEFRGADARGDPIADGATRPQKAGHLRCDARRNLGRQMAQGRGDSQRHAGLAEDVPEAGRLLGAEAGDAPDAADPRQQRHHGRQVAEARDARETVAADGRGHGDQVELGVLVGVVGPLEEVQHLLRHQETAHDVDRRQRRRGGPQKLRRRVRRQAASDEGQAAEGRRAGDGVRHGHQRRVEGRDHVEHRVVADDRRQGKRRQDRRRDARAEA
mmetsp:Transcript_26098/g.84475  ORF Transcript_26098/g.84475 Transcript_26098/m.84475 type:complete len:220 (-) Transcript_26098:1711-2370(-)